MQDDVKTPFAEQTSKLDKKNAGATDASATPVEIRSSHADVDPALHAWIHDRLGRQLGKYATVIERVQVRLGDENGSKGGIDKCCLIHVTLSKLPPVVVESRGVTEREAFDLAAGRAERATRRDMEKHGFHTHRSKHHEVARGEGLALESERAPEDEHGPGSEELASMVAWELETPSTESPGVSADDLKVGASNTAMRNFKQRTSGMQYELENSTTGKPTRKSTRGGNPGIKHANNLTQRAKAAVSSPKQNAVRAAAHHLGHGRGH